MINSKSIYVIIPALNEGGSIDKVVGDIPVFADEIIVVDNGSIDNTADAAASAGATVLGEQEKGYGAACLLGIKYVSSRKPDIIVFLDGDYSDYPGEMNELVKPIIEENIDMVIGSRLIGKTEEGSMLPQAVWGNKLASFLIYAFWKYKFTDLGPFRAIKFDKLIQLKMQDRNFGWTVEMQIKAAKQKFTFREVPVSYRKRIGVSKVTGTFTGTIKASYKILYTIFKYAIVN
jgi:glycosyltransferase involved in cell wall biosynthesis